MNFPEPMPFPKTPNPAWQPFQSDVNVPFMFVADNAFPLSKHCLKSYPERCLEDRKRIFNYRLSRFRRVTENAYGIQTNVFRIFSSKINLHPDMVTKVVLASLVLHNMLRTKSVESYTPADFTDEATEEHTLLEGQWRIHNTPTILKPLPDVRGTTRKNVRKKYVIYLLIVFSDPVKYRGNGTSYLNDYSRNYNL